MNINKCVCLVQIIASFVAQIFSLKTLININKFVNLINSKRKNLNHTANRLCQQILKKKWKIKINLIIKKIIKMA